MAMVRGPQYTLLYSAQCPNCSRFIESLRRTSVASEVRAVEVSMLPPDQLARVSAVPGLVMPNGDTMYGTRAFEWLKQFEGEMELDGFAGENGALAFSDVDNTQSYACYAQGYSAFQSVG